MSQSILILAAHLDDEVLGCGGTIAKLADQGATIHVAFLADGVFSRAGDQAKQQEELHIRCAAAQKACDILGVKSVSFDDFPDNRMDTVALLGITKALEELIAVHQPEVVFTHHAGDVNIDHRRRFCRVVNQKPKFSRKGTAPLKLDGFSPLAHKIGRRTTSYPHRRSRTGPCGSCA